MAAERVRRFLDEHEVPYDSETHERAVSAQRLAHAEHVSGWMVAKPVMLDADGELVMAVVPAPAYVDLERASESFDCDVRLASEDDFTGRFPDCEAGAEPPFGSMYDIRTVIDPILDEDEYIVFRAGTHDTTMRMRMSDYVAVEDPMRVVLAVHPTVV
jgi:Ala-tRNA(Pro) deacylase